MHSLKSIITFFSFLVPPHFLHRHNVFSFFYRCSYIVCTNTNPGYGQWRGALFISVDNCVCFFCVFFSRQFRINSPLWFFQSSQNTISNCLKSKFIVWNHCLKSFTWRSTWLFRFVSAVRESVVSLWWFSKSQKQRSRKYWRTSTTWAELRLLLLENLQFHLLWPYPPVLHGFS